MGSDATREAVPTAEMVRDEPPGPRLDMWVAVFVFGQAVHRDHTHRIWRLGEDRKNSRGRISSYSGRRDDSLDLVDWWKGDAELRRQNGHWLVTLFRPSEEFEAWGETLPLAVCRARLLAAIRDAEDR